MEEREVELAWVSGGREKGEMQSWQGELAQRWIMRVENIR